MEELYGIKTLSINRKSKTKITEIETEALKQLEGDDLVQFMSYAETAKYSLDFFL